MLDFIGVLALYFGAVDADRSTARACGDLTSESLLGREAELSSSTWLGGPVEKELAAIFQNKNEPQREDEVQTAFVDHRPNLIANERMRRGVFEAFGRPRQPRGRKPPVLR